MLATDEFETLARGRVRGQHGRAADHLRHQSAMVVAFFLESAIEVM